MVLAPPRDIPEEVAGVGQVCCAGPLAPAVRTWLVQGESTHTPEGASLEEQGTKSRAMQAMRVFGKHGCMCARVRV